MFKKGLHRLNVKRKTIATETSRSCELLFLVVSCVHDEFGLESCQEHAQQVAIRHSCSLARLDILRACLLSLGSEGVSFGFASSARRDAGREGGHDGLSIVQ